MALERVGFGAIGVEFRLSVRNPNGSDFDASLATGITFVFQKPSGARIEITGTLIGGGTVAPQITASTTVNTQLDESGNWQYWGRLVGPWGTHTTSRARFAVLAA